MNPHRWLLPLILCIIAHQAVAADRAPWKRYSQQPDSWYRGREGTRITANILSHQSPLGDWDKNFDSSQTPHVGDRSKIKGTFDNGATLGELRYLAQAFRATADPATHTAFIKGLDHILAAQYPTGGWPQSFPPGKGYNRHITFNDDTMVNLLQFLRDVTRSPDFHFVDAPRRVSAHRAFDAGIQCILASQIKVNGKLTVWCAQHDEITLEPRPARSYELVSLSGAESASVLLLLMSLEKPSPRVIQAVKSGVDWFEQTKLVGIRQTTVNNNKVMVPDPTAPPLWARFYEIPTNRPFFSGRDGKKKYDIAEIESERRNGYAWYGSWGTKVAARYAEWSKLNGPTLKN